MFKRLHRLISLTVLTTCLAAGPALAQNGPEPGDEGAIQAYLAMWSHNAEVTAAAVNRFYAPTVMYYGKHLTRAQVLADKLRFIRAWPVRHYSEVPGSIKADCNPDRSRCRISLVMAWRRESRDARTSSGHARIAFDFVSVEGNHKIAREAARNLGSSLR